MRKIATTLLLATILCCVSHARIDGVLEIDSADEINLTKIYFSDKETLLTGGLNYVVTYWFYDETANDGAGDFVPVGAGVVADMWVDDPAGEGFIYWNSNPETVLDLQPNKDYTYAIRIFCDAEMISLFGNPEIAGSDAAYGRIDMSPDAIAKKWAEAEAAWYLGVGEIGDFQFTMTSTDAGAPGVLSTSSDWWERASLYGGVVHGTPEALALDPDGHGRYYLKVHTIPDPIPEPSTWLLLGAGAAFVIIFRRRKGDRKESVK